MTLADKQLTLAMENNPTSSPTSPDLCHFDHNVATFGKETHVECSFRTDCKTQGKELFSKTDVQPDSGSGITMVTLTNKLFQLSSVGVSKDWQTQKSFKWSLVHYDRFQP